MIGFVLSAWACDVAGLGALEREPAPIGPRIAALCPHPLGLHAALRDPDDFSKDLAAATAQAGKWKDACPAGLGSLGSTSFRSYVAATTGSHRKGGSSLRASHSSVVCQTAETASRQPSAFS